MGTRKERRRLEREWRGHNLPKVFRDRPPHHPAKQPPAWIVPAALVIAALILGALTVGAVVEGG